MIKELHHGNRWSRNIAGQEKHGMVTWQGSSQQPGPCQGRHSQRLASM